MTQTRQPIIRLTLIAALTTGLVSLAVVAQDENRPQPSDPASQAAAEAAQDAIDPGTLQAEPARPAANEQPVNGTQPAAANGNGRPFLSRPEQSGKVQLGFNDVSVDELIPFIMEATGKVVMPVNMPVLKAKKITLMNDQFVERAAALDLLLTALRLNGVGVIEREDVVILDDVTNIQKIRVMPVLTATDDVMGRNDKGSMVVKIFKLKEAPAESVGERLSENLPDYASLSVDANSNQIVLFGDIGLAQHLQQIINELDRNYINISTRTFWLSFADATEVSEQIYELFEDTDTGGAGTPRAPRAPRAARGAGQPGQQAVTPAGASIGPVVPLRVSVNTQQNNVTVSAEPKKIDAIAKLVKEEWDLPRPEGTSKVYRLVYSDPIKVRDVLGDLLGSGGGGGRSSAGRAAGGAGGSVRAQTGGGGSDLSQQLSAIYRIEAYPDSNSLVVISKTEDALGFLDSIVAAIDQPSDIGLPSIVPLKHANAVSLSQELNLLLAESGTGGGSGLEMPESGLTGPTIGSMSDGGSDTAGGGRTGGATGGGAGGSSGRIQFPWQSGRARDDVAPETSLIGRVRIVPIIRQNALAVLTPPEKREAVLELIQSFDRPARQVMISAVLAAVQITDDLSLGLRFSSFDITPAQTDNAIGGSAAFEGTDNNFMDNIFDTSVLDVNVDVNVLLQALSQKTNVRILQEPRVFTSDNEEAVFFDGQNIPILTSTNTSDVGGFQQNVEYRDVGVVLNARPRITAQRDVDMEIYLELSNVVPGQTLAGSPVFDQRYTSTRVIVKNGQTIVLAGILKDQESQITRGIPLLMDIPWLGELFKSRENSIDRRELVAFITPVVVDNPAENDTNFNATERDNLRALTRSLNEQAADKDRIKNKIVNPKVVSPSSSEQRPAPDHVEAPAPIDEGTESSDEILHDIDDLVEESPKR